jgi:fluoride ion exporter CrcB/FEX
MTYQMRSVRVLQTSLMAAILYFVLSLLICIPMFFVGLAIPNTSNNVFSSLGSVLFLFLPFLYAILGFIFSALGCLVYNVVAKFTGGIAFTLEEIK